MKIFEMESPLMRGLTKMADLMILNLLFLVCSIPLITVGASFTALHYVALKLVRGEETYIMKQFFHAFKENFVRATLMWLLFLLICVILGVDIVLGLRSEGTFAVVALIFIILVAVLVLLTFAMAFPIQAKFVNSFGRIIRSGLLLAVAYFPRTVCMLIFYVAPLALCYQFVVLVPVGFLFGASLPCYLAAHLYDKPFMKMEEQTLRQTGSENPGDEDEHIFSDKPLNDE